MNALQITTRPQVVFGGQPGTRNVRALSVPVRPPWTTLVPLTTREGHGVGDLHMQIMPGPERLEVTAAVADLRTGALSMLGIQSWDAAHYREPRSFGPHPGIIHDRPIGLAVRWLPPTAHVGAIMQIPPACQADVVFTYSLAVGLARAEFARPGLGVLDSPKDGGA